MEQLLEETQRIQDFLEITTSDDPNELINRLTDINVYMARSGKMLADAKRLQDDSISRVYSQHFNAVLKMPATVATKFITSQTSDENHLVNWFDRVNKTCTHQGDNIRTQISFAKEELRLTKNGY